MTIYDFVALDFETATQHYSSACAIGIAAVKDGRIVDRYYSLIKPPEMKFNQETIEIHGITPELVKDSPTFDDLWPKVRHFFNSNLIVAHNAHFDISVLKKSLNKWEPPNFKFVDSVSLAKDFVDGSKSLSNCSACFGIDMGIHHNALDDAISCAKIVLCCLEQSGLSNIVQLCFALENVKIHTVSDIQAQDSYSTHRPKYRDLPASSHVRPADIVQTVECISSAHPLYGKIIVFTGELSIDRRTAMQMAVNVGAIVRSSVSRKTNYLVVGKQDTDLVGEDGLSSKEEKAYALNEAGNANIKIIGETEFTNLIDSCVGGIV